MKSWKEVKKELDENGFEGRLMWVDKRKGGRRRKIMGGGMEEKEREILERNGFRKFVSEDYVRGKYLCWVRFEEVSEEEEKRREKKWEENMRKRLDKNWSEREKDEEIEKIKRWKGYSCR
jgi:hypothetical protein